MEYVRCKIAKPARVSACWQGLLSVLQWEQGLHADHGEGAQHAAAPGPHPPGSHLPSQRQGPTAPQGQPPAQAVMPYMLTLQFCSWPLSFVNITCACVTLCSASLADTELQK